MDKEKMLNEKLKRGRPCIGDEPLAIRLGVRVSHTLLDRLEAICRKRGVTKSKLITEALEKTLVEEEQHAA